MLPDGLLGQQQMKSLTQLHKLKHGKLRRPGDSQRESGRFARIDWQRKKKKRFSEGSSNSLESPQTCDLRNQSLEPRNAIREKGGRVCGRAPKERRRGRAEKRLSKGVFLESPFLLCSLKVFRTFQFFKERTSRGQRRNGLSKNTLLDNRFSARPLRRSFGAPWVWETWIDSRESGHLRWQTSRDCSSIPLVRPQAIGSQNA